MSLCGQKVEFVNDAAGDRPLYSDTCALKTRMSEIYT